MAWHEDTVRTIANGSFLRLFVLDVVKIYRVVVRSASKSRSCSNSASLGLVGLQDAYTEVSAGNPSYCLTVKPSRNKSISSITGSLKDSENCHDIITEVRFLKLFPEALGHTALAIGAADLAVEIEVPIRTPVFSFIL